MQWLLLLSKVVCGVVMWKNRVVAYHLTTCDIIVVVCVIGVVVQLDGLITVLRLLNRLLLAKQLMLVESLVLLRLICKINLVLGGSLSGVLIANCGDVGMMRLLLKKNRLGLLLVGQYMLGSLLLVRLS